MKALLFVFPMILLGCSEEPLFTDTGTFTDSRDSIVYSWVKIGDQTWMAQNMAFLPTVNLDSDTSSTVPCYYVYDYSGVDVKLAIVDENYHTYGVLYNWVAAKTACPSGWHLPSKSEWTILTEYLGTLPGKRMKSVTGWRNSGNNANSSGFNALPGGQLSFVADFRSLGKYAAFWSSSSGYESEAWYRSLVNSSSNVFQNRGYRSIGFSVRCLKDL